MAGGIVFLAAIYINIGSWKAWALFIIAAALGITKLCMMLYPIAVKYWREDDTIS